MDKQIQDKVKQALIKAEELSITYNFTYAYGYLVPAIECIFNIRTEGKYIEEIKRN